MKFKPYKIRARSKLEARAIIAHALSLGYRWPNPDSATVDEAAYGYYCEPDGALKRTLIALSGPGRLSGAALFAADTNPEMTVDAFLDLTPEDVRVPEVSRDAPPEGYRLVERWERAQAGPTYIWDDSIPGWCRTVTVLWDELVRAPAYQDADEPPLAVPASVPKEAVDSDPEISVTMDARIRTYAGQPAEAYGLTDDSFVLLWSARCWRSCFFRSLDPGDQWRKQLQAPTEEEA